MTDLNLQNLEHTKMTKQLENAPVLMTTLVTYYLNIENAEQRDEYEKLCSRLNAKGYKCFNVLADTKPNARNSMTTGRVALETTHLFGNQWNTTDDSPTNPNARVFDWYEGIVPNKSIKAGHYLEYTDEMREIKNKVGKCGYCGAMHWLAKGLVFCNQCLGSEYLKEDDLHLLRIQPISEDGKKRAKLSDGERNHLMPLYIAAQTEGADTRQGQRLAKQRADIQKEYEKTVSDAAIKRDGFTWLMDHNINIDNCIYYSHTGVFCFGWRSPVSDSVRDRLLEVISEFPFPYEIKCADGKKLEGY